MKISHIVLIVVLIVGIGIIITTVFNTDSYADFKEARSAPGKEFQIIGTSVKEKAFHYDSIRGIFSFYMKDDEGNEAMVTYQGAQPVDFEKLEQVVVIGQWKDSSFMASSLLLKCPSKYNEENKPIGFEERVVGPQ